MPAPGMLESPFGRRRAVASWPSGDINRMPSLALPCNARQYDEENFSCC